MIDMFMETVIVLSLVCAAAVAVLFFMFVFFRSRSREEIAEKDSRIKSLEGDLARLSSELGECRGQLIRKESEIEAQKSIYENRVNSYERDISGMKENYEKSIREMKESHRESLERQVSALQAEMTARTEQILKEREAELSKKAESVFSTITSSLGKDLEQMKRSFDENRQAHITSSASLKTHLEDAVRHLREQTENIGNKADHLANALRGKNKMQGCWGETILNNIFIQEGLVEGRDYDKEATLRDDMGIAIINEESGRKMRPDFILHYPDNTDIIVDSKVSLDAFSDYYAAEDPAVRDDAAKRNLRAIREQVDKLSSKRYWENLPAGRKTLDYVIMFIPNYGAMQLAKSLDPDIFRDSYRKNVLITTEETIMPFLRMIRAAWVNYEQVRNQEKIVKAAQNMIERVAEFSTAHAEMGEKLQAAVKCFEKCDSKLRDGGRSIVQSAKQVVGFGIAVNPKKRLPSLAGSLSESEPDESGSEQETVTDGESAE